MRELEPGIPDAVIRIDRIPGGGRDLSLVADVETLESLATRLDVTSVERLAAEITVSRVSGGLRAGGRLRAAITQPCVVSFEPVHETIDESIDRVFLPASQRPKDPRPETEAFVDLEGEDPPDYYQGNDLDLSELIIETLALAIDPYPRAPGVELPAEARDEDVSDHPFAVLSGLRKNET